VTDSLEQLLRATDAANPARSPSVDPAGAAQRVRTRRRAQQLRIRAISAAACVLLVIAGGVWLGMRPSPATSPHRTIVKATGAQPSSTRPVTATLVAFDLQSELHEQTAARLIRSGDARATRRVTAVSAIADVQTQRDRAALILVYEAERSARENRTRDAVASYRRTIELFPHSPWAQVARERLKELPTS